MEARLTRRVVRGIRVGQVGEEGMEIAIVEVGKFAVAMAAPVSILIAAMHGTDRMEKLV